MPASSWIAHVKAVYAKGKSKGMSYKDALRAAALGSEHDDDAKKPFSMLTELKQHTRRLGDKISTSAVGAKAQLDAAINGEEIDLILFGVIATPSPDQRLAKIDAVTHNRIHWIVAIKFSAGIDPDSDENDRNMFNGRHCRLSQKRLDNCIMGLPSVLIPNPRPRDRCDFLRLMPPFPIHKTSTQL